MKTLFIVLCLTLASAPLAAQTAYGLPTVYELTGHNCGPRINDPIYTVQSNDGTMQTGLVYGYAYCSTGGRGSIGATYSGCASAQWDESGNLLSYTILKQQWNRGFYVDAAWCFGS